MINHSLSVLVGGGRHDDGLDHEKNSQSILHSPWQAVELDRGIVPVKARTPRSVSGQRIYQT